jgi:segregation and condensation protein B
MNESVFEAILFAVGEPISLERIALAIDEPPRHVRQALRELQTRLMSENRGVRIVEMEDMFQMVSSPEHADMIRKLLEERKPAPLSKAALEVLSVVAYHQPVTRGEIERIRGVDSSNTVSTLVEKQLIEECGHLEVLGRPMQFRTTPLFLRAVGLTSLNELPDLELLGSQITFEDVEKERAEEAEPS